VLVVVLRVWYPDIACGGECRECRKQMKYQGFCGGFVEVKGGDFFQPVSYTLDHIFLLYK